MNAQDFDDANRKGNAGIFISQALQLLLAEKHLYQNLRIGEELLTSFIKQGKIELEEAAIKSVVEEVGSPWILEFRNRSRMEFLMGGLNPDFEVKVAVPTANIFCNTCEEKHPFNADPKQFATHSLEDYSSVQWFFLSYLCQNCKTQISKILISRDGQKVFISGRDPLEFVPPPSALPKKCVKYFSSATIAYNAGQTLPGLFLLRTFVEQFWLTIPACLAVKQEKKRPTGDELGAAYNSTLPDDFKRNFPSLLAVYDGLSAALHEAHEDNSLFEDSSSKIVEHFEARRIFKLG